MNWVEGMRGLAGRAAACGGATQRQVYLGQVAKRLKGRAVSVEFTVAGLSKGGLWRITGLHAGAGHGGCLVESIKVDGHEWLATREPVPLAVFAARSEGVMAPVHLGDMRTSVVVTVRRMPAQKGLRALVIVRSRRGLRTRTKMRENEACTLSRVGKLPLTVSVLESR
jgi:hypothetical protein